jgi:hypothetical protein
MAVPNCIECWDKIANKEANSEQTDFTLLCRDCKKPPAFAVIEISGTQELIY